MQDEFCSFVPDSMTVVGPAKCYFEVTLVGTGHLDTANLFVGVAFRGFRTGSHRPDIGDPSGALFDRAAFLVSGFEHMAAFGQTLRCAQGDVTPNNGVKGASNTLRSAIYTCPARVPCRVSERWLCLCLGRLHAETVSVRCCD